MSPVQSPPIQVMERPGDFDPDRIPASVFSSKPSTAVGWSVASNESLFSIQIGNNSFSREQFLMMNEDVCKYEESCKSGELYRSGDLYMSDVGKKSEETGVLDETMKDPPKENVVDQVKEKTPHLEKTENSSAVNRHPDGSSTSCQSFAFPIKKRSGWPLCHCSNCSWAFCYCTWPNCWCKWASCYCYRWLSFYCCSWPVMLPLKWASCKSHGSNCSCAFCYSWNYILKTLCSYSPCAKILTNNARTVSGFGSLKHQGLQTTDSKNSPKARKASKNCWSCCSLPSWSCSLCRHCWWWTCWC